MQPWQKERTYEKSEDRKLHVGKRLGSLMFGLSIATVIYCGMVIQMLKKPVKNDRYDV